MQLKDSESDLQVRNVINIIDRNINNSDDWKFFEEAFNNADKGFLKKIRKLHPELTPNDLRLSAYLRLNLSSHQNEDSTPVKHIRSQCGGQTISIA